MIIEAELFVQKSVVAAGFVQTLVPEKALPLIPGLTRKICKITSTTPSPTLFKNDLDKTRLLSSNLL